MRFSAVVFCGCAEGEYLGRSAKVLVAGLFKAHICSLGSSKEEKEKDLP